MRRGGERPGVTNIKQLTPGLDNTRLFMSLTAGAGTRCMSLPFHLQAYEKREETRLGDDHPEALVITVQTNECLGIGGYLQSNGQQIFFQHFFLAAVQRILEGNRNLPPSFFFSSF